MSRIRKAQDKTLSQDQLRAEIAELKKQSDELEKSKPKMWVSQHSRIKGPRGVYDFHTVDHQKYAERERIALQQQLLNKRIRHLTKLLE